VIPRARRRSGATSAAGCATRRTAPSRPFEGEPDDVEALVWFVRSGPGSAEVDRVDVDEEEPEGLRRFEVRE
jgi:hypothetical protein